MIRLRLPFLAAGLALMLGGAGHRAQAQEILFKNFSEVQVTGAVTGTASANSHALIMFNADYANAAISDLPVTANDAEAVKRLFLGMGYPEANITVIGNATKFEMKQAVFDFTARLTEDSSVVVYYSGHGISFKGDSSNYIVPVDLDPQVTSGSRQLREAMFKDRSVNFNEDVLGTIKVAGPKGVVVFYDACRNSPLAADGDTKAVGGGDSFVPAKIQGTAMFYSASPGQTSLAALENERDANLSVFTRVLVSKLATNPTMRLSDLHAVVQSDVSRLAREKARGHQQKPVYADELDYSRSDHNEFCLATVAVNGVARCTGRDEVLTGQVTATPVAVTPPPVSNAGKGEIERLYWDSIKDSDDPREIESYLSLYPDGAFAPLARLRLDRLTAAAQTNTRAAAEAAFWTSVKDTDDIALLRRYIAEYPEGQFVALAQARIAQIEAAAYSAQQNQALAAYQDAQAKDTQGAYEAYLRFYPGGEHASAVRSHLSRMQSLYQPTWCRGSASLNRTESAICNNYELGRLDGELTVAFNTSGGRVSNADQRDWRLYNRDACNENIVCIANSTRERIAYLGTARPAPSSGLRSRYQACPATGGPWSVNGVSTGDWLNVRASANGNAAILGALAFNATGVSVSNCQSSGWCYVQHGCTAGWAFGQYLGRSATGANSAFAGVYSVTDHPLDSLLNVRSGPGTEFPVVGELPPDATGIRVTDCQRVKGWKLRWCTVSHSSGAVGWAYGEYLANQWGQKPS